MGGGDDRAQARAGAAKPGKATKPPKLYLASIRLYAGAPVDRLSIAAWITFMRANDRPELAEAAEDASSFLVARRWPKDGTPWPRIPRDFTKAKLAER